MVTTGLSTLGFLSVIGRQLLANAVEATDVFRD